MTAPSDPALAAFAAALDLPPDADVTTMVRRIDALRLVRDGRTLDQVQRGLGLAADTPALDCAGELCRRLPLEWHYPAVLVMQVVATNERGRMRQVELVS